ncbi:hypothetical protein J3R30DRAFT_1842868 [Lentinula aciculospora]|uniref:C2H2-type domain-containing protein n=1 Tax=Lentinula aciculospora TaxID=153920 RepID=A0A9W9DS99_9AGAR|nr:hypothetical protein J3R30DRAFT_1842868 [Lentinula aciculospora]
MNHYYESSEDEAAYCTDCGRTFVDTRALQQHYRNSPAHQESDHEDDCYSSSEQEDTDDYKTYCQSCDRKFKDSLSLFQHLAASSRHDWCFICSRDFSSPNALAQHSSSPVHRARDIRCPLCKESFKMVSAIAQHIESGSCRSDINRHTVTQAVRSLNLVPAISINRRITGGSTSRTITSYSATERAYNGSAYECYLCHRTFNTLNALNTHLSSPAHDTKEFRCPKCRNEYSLISGLVHHIESEACGIAKFEAVRKQMLGLTNSFRKMLTM